ncbi:hypothetical protein ACROYT_G032914 [Oculina patagonica]
MEICNSKDSRRNSAERKPRFKNIVHLWEFLLELLANESLSTIISWRRKEYKEFKLKSPEEVARRWGIFRGKKGMTYQKLSRALRFYYGQGIIEKVPGQTFTYRFANLPYKYEPGVTRSLHHSHKMAASSSIHDQEKTPDKNTLPQIHTNPSTASGQASFPPSGTPWGSCISWSLVPKLELPVRMYPHQSNPQLTPQLKNVVTGLCGVTLPVHVTAPVTGLRPSLHASTAKSIPVSVIKRVAPIPKTNTYSNATVSSVCVTGELPMTTTSL